MSGTDMAAKSRYVWPHATRFRRGDRSEEFIHFVEGMLTERDRENREGNRPGCSAQPAPASLIGGKTN